MECAGQELAGLEGVGQEGAELEGAGQELEDMGQVLCRGAVVKSPPA